MVPHVLVKVAQLCPTLCEPMDYTVHGILQARILEWVAFPFSKGSSQPRDWTQVSHIGGGFFTSWATREAQEYWSGSSRPRNRTGVSCIAGGFFTNWAIREAQSYYSYIKTPCFNQIRSFNWNDHLILQNSLSASGSWSTWCVSCLLCILCSLCLECSFQKAASYYILGFKIQLRPYLPSSF